MQIRKDILSVDQHYHIFNRSIAGFVIFNNNIEYDRFYEMLNLMQYVDFNYKYSNFLRLTPKNQLKTIANLQKQNKKIVEIIAYCLMPTHIHLILKQKTAQGISKFMSKILNSYSRFFNTHHKRIGPLWAGRFKSVLIKTDEQLLHLTRYVHLNPTSAGIVEKPEQWNYSSYSEYIDNQTKETKLCQTNNLFNFSHKEYKEFVDDRKEYQRELSKIKKMLIDNYTG